MGGTIPATTTMHEGPNPGIERAVSASEKLFQTWKQGPVILASGSRLKLENLRALGIPQATNESVPEEVEDDVFKIFDGRPMHMHEMVAAIVAKEKVAHVVESGVPDDALVCAFDTVVMETTGSLQTKKRRYLQKPETREQATADLTKYFTNLVEGKIWKDELNADLIEEATRLNKLEAMEPYLSVGHPQALVHITTGMAVRLPHAGDKIEMIPSTIRLRPNALYELTALTSEERQKKIAEVVEKALTIMDENERWRSVTTGIDYSDPRIKELLGLEEAKLFSFMDDSEHGIMQGMPRQAFDQYLLALAKEKSGSGSDSE